MRAAKTLRRSKKKVNLRKCQVFTKPNRSRSLTKRARCMRVTIQILGTDTWLWRMSTKIWISFKFSKFAWCSCRELMWIRDKQIVQIPTCLNSEMWASKANFQSFSSLAFSKWTIKCLTRRASSKKLSFKSWRTFQLRIVIVCPKLKPWVPCGKRICRNWFRSLARILSLLIIDWACVNKNSKRYTRRQI